MDQSLSWLKLRSRRACWVAAGRRGGAVVVDSLLNEFKFQILDSVEGLLSGDCCTRCATCRRVGQVTERNEILIHFMCLWVGYVRCFPDGRNVDYDEAECRNTTARRNKR